MPCGVGSRGRQPLGPLPTPTVAGGKLGQDFLALDAEGAKVRQSLTAAQAEAGGWPLRCAARSTAGLPPLLRSPRKFVLVAYTHRIGVIGRCRQFGGPRNQCFFWKPNFRTETARWKMFMSTPFLKKKLVGNSFFTYFILYDFFWTKGSFGLYFAKRSLVPSVPAKFTG